MASTCTLIHSTRLSRYLELSEVVVIYPGETGTVRRPKAFTSRRVVRLERSRCKARSAESEPTRDTCEATSTHIRSHNGLSCSPQLRSTQRRHRGRPQSRRQARTRDRVVTLTAGSRRKRTSACFEKKMLAILQDVLKHDGPHALRHLNAISTTTPGVPLRAAAQTPDSRSSFDGWRP